MQTILFDEKEYKDDARILYNIMENISKIPFLQINPEKVPRDLVIKNVKKEGTEYKIWRTGDSVENDETLGKYNSVVLSEPEGQVLCYTPAKSIPLETFMARYPDISTEDLLANEAIEGTLISAFWDERLDSWEIATKGAIGGNYWFYRTRYPGFHASMEQKTFRDMFVDAIGCSGDINESLGDLPKRHLEETLCYNFVLQHPENHIVFDIDTPKLYLVSVYGICNHEIHIVPREEYEEWVHQSQLNAVIYFPQKYVFAEWSAINKDNHPMGLMVTHKNGDRTCIENPQYLSSKELRGNHPNLQYRFLELRQKDMVQPFLADFPQYIEIFYYFHLQYEGFTSYLHDAYVSYYIKKSGVLIPKPFFCIIRHLHHTVYLPSLSTEKIVMKRNEFAKHVRGLTPKQLIYFLNYSE
jgi:hypothetical protein